MHTSTVSKNGNAKKCYPEKRKRAVDTSNYRWVKTDCGRVGLCIICLLAEERTGPGGKHTRNFKDQGIVASYLCERLLWFMPWFAKEYETKRISTLDGQGVPITPDIVYNRFNKMGYNTGPKGKSFTCAYGPEHPLNHKVLQRVITPTERFFKANKKISRKDVQTIIQEAFSE